MKYRPAKNSTLLGLFTRLFAAFWIIVGLYPIAWHLQTSDVCYRNYALWRQALIPGTTLLAYYDFYHSYVYPVHNAVIRNRIDLLRQMPPEQLSSNKKDGFEMTPLAYAARFGLKAELEYLVAQGANPDISTTNKMTALMHAIDRNKYQLALHLIENGADTSLTEVNGITAIHMAAALDQYQIIARASENERNRQSFSLKDNSGLTPLDFAIHFGSLRAAKELAACGADCTFSLTPQKDEMSIFLSAWQQSGAKPFTMPGPAEANGSCYKPPINVTIPAELPENVKPETFRNRGQR